MKTTLFCGAALAILGVAAVPMSAQTQSTSSTNTTYIQTSKLIGTKVKAAKGEDIGEIKDVVLDQNGCMAYTVVSTGSTTSRLTGSSKTVAVPWSVYSTTSDPRVLTVRVEREKIYSAPAFEYSRINEYSTSGYINNVNTYYGVAPGGGIGVSVSGGVSNSSTTTTGVGVGTSTSSSTTTATATASPVASATASPVATASMTPLGTATPNPSVSPSPAASASATATVSASATPSRHTNAESTAGKAKSGMTPVSPRRHTEMTTDSESSASKKKSGDASSSDETATTVKKSHKHPGEGSEPSATPEAEKQ